MQRPCVLTIAGFDPSSGAGLSADLKTFESLGIYGLGVCTAVTFQSHKRFYGVRWMGAGDIHAQLDALFPDFAPAAVKIGIVESLPQLGLILEFLGLHCPEAPVVWDPVIRSSTGFFFHEHPDRSAIESCCGRITVITPNREEMEMMFPGVPVSESAEILSRICAVLVTGVEKTSKKVTDHLYHGGSHVVFEHPAVAGTGKHGSGCVFSSALAAGLASGKDLESACGNAGKYTGNFLRGDAGLPGYNPLPMDMKATRYK